MRTQFIIYSDNGYLPGAQRLWKDLNKQGLTVMLKQVDSSWIPAGPVERPWLAKSFCWFERLEFDERYVDRVVILDADLRCVGDIQELATMRFTEPLAMVPDHHDRWQTGVVVINANLPEMMHDLVEMIPWRAWPKGDQSLLNEYLRRMSAVRVKVLPREYSWCAPDGVPTPEVKLLHFHGVPKPWEPDYPQGKHPYTWEP